MGVGLVVFWVAGCGRDQGARPLGDKAPAPVVDPEIITVEIEVPVETGDDDLDPEPMQNDDGPGGAGGAPIVEPDPSGGAPSLDPDQPDDEPLELPDAALLVGHYDVDIVDQQIPVGCNYFIETYGSNITEAQERLNVSVRKVDGELQARVAFDFAYGTYAAATITPEGTLSAVGAGHQPPHTTLHLDLDAEGFAGTGTLGVELLCGDVFAEHTAKVVIGPDVTPPQARLTQIGGEPHVSFSHTRFGVIFSEELADDWDGGGTFWTVEGGQGRFGLIDAQTGQDYPVVIEPWWISGVYLRLIDRAPAEGRTVILDTRLPATDEAGNRWVADTTPVHLHPSGPARSLHDFATAPEGLGNGARHIAPGALGSPCESGGCVILEGTTCPENGDCIGRPYLAVVNDALDRRYSVARVRLYSKSPTLSWYSVVSEVAGVGYSSSNARPKLLDEPYQGYAYAFDWTWVADGFWPGAPEKPYIYLLPYAPDPIDVALVIDRIVVNDCPLSDCP